MYKKTTLNNGIRVITHNMPKMQSIALGIWIKVGGRYESIENKGSSHYLEHMLFKGSKKYSCRKIKESIEGVGGYLNAFTSEEFTCYFTKLPSKHINLSLDILSDMAINPLLGQADIDKERTVILEEIKMYKDLPQSYVYDLLDELLWPNHPLGMSIIGSSESVSRIDKDDLSSYQRAYYSPLNMVISAAGPLSHNILVNRIKDIFSPLKDKTINVFCEVKESQHKPQLKIMNKDTEQTHMALGFHSFKRDHPLKHAVALLHIILGANMSSRLFNEVREKRGLAYEIGTAVKRFHDTGAFLVHAGIDNHKVTETINVVLKEIEKIRQALVSIDEFKRAKDFYLGQLMLALEDTLDHMLWIGETTSSMDKVYALKDIVKEVNRIERKDIKEVANHIFREKAVNLALIGPLKDKENAISNQLRIA